MKPNLLIVQGDTITALAATIANEYNEIPVAHIGIDLRTFNISNPCPEELNRKLVDSFARLMFAPTPFTKEVLLREGECDADVFVTKNTSIDAFYKSFNQTHSTTDNISILKIIQEFNENRTTILVTMHRRENFPSILEICRAMKTISKLDEENVLIVLLIHPNPNVKHVGLQELSGLNNVKIIESISVDVFAYIIVFAGIIVTDSEGIQEEAANIGKPVVFM